MNKFDYIKLILTDDYLYELGKEEKQIDKKSDKKEPPKKPQKRDENEFDKLIIKEIDWNTELFRKHFNFQMPNEMLKTVYNTESTKKIDKLVNMIKSGLSDLKDEIEKISKAETEI